jgi:hypothetical protein
VKESFVMSNRRYRSNRSIEFAFIARIEGTEGGGK